MKQSGNITGRSKPSSKPTPKNLKPTRTLSKLKKGVPKKRKRGKKQNARSSFNRRRAAAARPARNRSRMLTRRKRKPRSSARRQARSASSTSSYESGSSSCSCCKKPCRSVGSDKTEEGSGSPSVSKSGSFQDSIPATKPISPDASQLNPALEQWDLNMAQATHEPLDALGQFEPPGIPPAQENPQEKPRGMCAARYQNPCHELR